MALNIKDLTAKAKALHAEIQSAVNDSEHIIETAKGDVETGQLVNAAGAIHIAVTNLENHAKAVEAILKANGAPAPAATPTAK